MCGMRWPLWTARACARPRTSGCAPTRCACACWPRKGPAARSGRHLAAQLARACGGAAEGRHRRGKGGQARDRRCGGAVRILQPDRTIPYVSLEILRPGGNALLKPADQGLAQLTAATLTDGCGTRDLDAMERFVAERAASPECLGGRAELHCFPDGPGPLQCRLLRPAGRPAAQAHLCRKDVRRQADTLKAAWCAARTIP